MNPLIPLTSFADVVDLLVGDNVPHRVNPDSQVVEIPTVSPVLNSAILVRWEKTLPYVQLIVPLPFALPPERVAAMESAVVRVNNAIALPGFGIDHSKGLVYFRLTLPRDAEGNIKVQLLQRMMAGAVSNAREFVTALRGVTQGEPAEDVMNKAVEQAHAARGAEGGVGTTPGAGDY